MNNPLTPQSKPTKEDHLTSTSEQSNLDFAKDLTWVDMLKGLAIISVFFGNWSGYFLGRGFEATQSAVYSFPIFLRTAIGPVVQVFIILSGFGLTLGYLKVKNATWSWTRWSWRRITKIIFPHYIFVILSFALGITGSVLFESVNLQFSWKSLFAYLTFTRNLYPPSWVWNPPLWYMPVIIGLYIIFPVLLIILRKWGPVKLLLISILITYTSLIITAIAGATGSHASDFFLSWTFQFAMGIVLAFIRVNNAEKLHLLIGFRAFIIGAALYFCAWILRTYIPNGMIFNDSVTSPGIFLMVLNLGWGLRKIMPSVNKYIYILSKQSYFMYLIHWPVMAFIIAPILPIAMHPIVIIILGGIYILMIFYLCSFISKPITEITSKLLAMYDAKNQKNLLKSQEFPS